MEPKPISNLSSQCFRLKPHNVGSALTFIREVLQILERNVATITTSWTEAHVHSKSTLWMMRTAWPARADRKLSGFHPAGTTVVRRVRARSPATSENRPSFVGAPTQNCDANGYRVQQLIMLMMTLVRMLVTMVETDQYIK